MPNRNEGERVNSGWSMVLDRKKSLLRPKRWDFFQRLGGNNVGGTVSRHAGFFAAQCCLHPATTHRPPALPPPGPPATAAPSPRSVPAAPPASPPPRFDHPSAPECDRR